MPDIFAKLKVAKSLVELDLMRNNGVPRPGSMPVVDRGALQDWMGRPTMFNNMAGHTLYYVDALLACEIALVSWMKNDVHARLCDAFNIIAMEANYPKE